MIRPNPLPGTCAGKMVREYPPEVLEHLHLSYYPGNGHAG